MTKIGMIVAAGLVAAAGTAASAQFVTLNDGNSTARWNLTPGAGIPGLDTWSVDGVDHMYSQWFWYRAGGMTNEARVNALPVLNGPSLSDLSDDGIDDSFSITYGTLDTFTIRIQQSLVGGSAGSNVSDIAQQIRITNRGTTALTFSFFQYADFDLNADIIDDGAEVVNANALRQWDTTGNFTVNETVYTPTFSRAEINVFATTINSLDDAGITDLNNTFASTPGRRDYTWALQWNVTIPAGGSYLISKDLQLVPTPGAAALMGMGLLASARRRRA